MPPRGSRRRGFMSEIQTHICFPAPTNPRPIRMAANDAALISPTAVHAIPAAFLRDDAQLATAVAALDASAAGDSSALSASPQSQSPEPRAQSTSGSPARLSPPLASGNAVASSSGNNGTGTAAAASATASSATLAAPLSAARIRRSTSPGATLSAPVGVTAPTIVLKIGSSSLASADGRHPNLSNMCSLVCFWLSTDGLEIYVSYVSSPSQILILCATTIAARAMPYVYHIMLATSIIMLSLIITLSLFPTLYLPQVETICTLRSLGHRVVLVSSGAVAVGCQRLHLHAKPTDLVTKQAVAAVGQARVRSLLIKISFFEGASSGWSFHSLRATSRSQLKCL